MIDLPNVMYPLLDVKGLHRPPLIEASLTLGAGECVVISAPSGAGKSLLLRAIADLDPHDGEVWLNGAARGTIPAPVWRRQVSYVPAASGWWAATVGEHMAECEKAAALLPRLAMPVDALAWPVARLSTGERQRLALIRALIAGPRVLLLDEPTSGLDACGVAAVEALLRECLARGAGILMVSHDAAQAARLGLRRLTIAAGRVIGEVGGGSP